MVEALEFTERVRLLGCEFTFRTNSEMVWNLLRAITPHAKQNMPVTLRFDLSVTWSKDEFRILGEGIDDFEFSPVMTVQAVYQAMQDLTLAAVPDHIPMAAALGIDREKCFLLVGRGKTTLSVRLMLASMDLAGDALALLRNGYATAFPRKFLLRPDSLALLPEIGTINSLAEVPPENQLMLLDPHDFGRPWRIAPTPVSTIVYIEPNYGGRSRLLRCGKLEMTRRVTPYCAMPRSGRRDWIGDLSDTVDRAENLIVELGDLDTAAAVLGDALLADRADIGGGDDTDHEIKPSRRKTSRHSATSSTGG
jgi:hypothetical protein